METKQRSFLTDILSVFGNNIFILIITFFTSIILARYLGPDGRGIYAAILIYPILLTSLAELGIRQATVTNPCLFFFQESHLGQYFSLTDEKYILIIPCILSNYLEVPSKFLEKFILKWHSSSYSPPHSISIITNIKREFGTLFFALSSSGICNASIFDSILTSEILSFCFLSLYK